MRLINTDTHLLEDYSTRPKPDYAVLSHRWTDTEVTFPDICSGDLEKRSGFAKIRGTIEQTQRDSLQYLWVDTCCIDKQSSAELSEAINSMYSWYEGAARCYVYLHDVEVEKEMRSFRDSLWFTRGWTLQEMLAPPIVYFYDRDWHFLGDRRTLSSEISQVTGIDREVLETGNICKYSVAQKMSWAAKRITTRLEDRAYCLMGLFDVNMPLIYGEGERAFLRLQEEIIKDKDDQSIFAWSMDTNKFSGLLAPRPACFARCEQTISRRSPGGRQPFSMTNRGLSIRLKITPWSADTYLAYLECSRRVAILSSPQDVRVGIFLRRLTEDDQYARINLDGEDLLLDTEDSYERTDRPTLERQLFVRKHVDSEEEKHCLVDRIYGYRIPDSWLPRSCRISVADHLLDERVAVLPPGGWGQTMALDVSAERKGLKQITLGFDFDFHPLCLLEDSFKDGKDLDACLDSCLDWSNNFPQDFNWYEIHEGSRVYRRKDHDGTWALKGHRLRGLDVVLSKSPMHNGSLVTLQRDEEVSPLVWEVWIDNLAGPFASHADKQFENSWGDRSNFQASFGLKMTPEDLQEGNAALKALDDPFRSFRNAK